MARFTWSLDGIVAALVPDGDCMVWPHTRFHYGHGRVWFERREWRVHRLVWTRLVGPIPDGLCVLHRCDNPPCARLDHLFLGTIADNNHDRDAKARHVHGQGVNTVRLTEDQVRAIAANPESYADIARRYGVATPTVKDIFAGRTWKHLGLPIQKRPVGRRCRQLARAGV